MRRNPRSWSAERNSLRRNNTPLECLQPHNFDIGRELRLYIVCCHYQTSDAVARGISSQPPAKRAPGSITTRAGLATGHVSHSELRIVVRQRGPYTDHKRRRRLLRSLCRCARPAGPLM